MAEIALEGRLEEALSRLPATEVEDEFRALLAQGRERDRAAARALEGPHLSDLIVTHGPKNAPAAHCSSGEQKALLIGLILAKAELIKELEGAAPLVLFGRDGGPFGRGPARGAFCRNLQAWAPRPG